LRRTRRDAAGRVLVKLVVLVSLSACAMAGIYGVLERARQAARCAENLRKIYRALEAYEANNNRLPSLAIFPDAPMKTPDGSREFAQALREAIRLSALEDGDFICPAAPEALAALGLTYVWNVRLNGRRLPGKAERDWMLIDMCALSTNVPAPHLGRYNVLYTDGTVERVGTPPPDLERL
jgi:hypothetical protein